MLNLVAAIILGIVIVGQSVQAAKVNFPKIKEREILELSNQWLNADPVEFENLWAKIDNYSPSGPSFVDRLLSLLLETHSRRPSLRPRIENLIVLAYRAARSRSPSVNYKTSALRTSTREKAHELITAIEPEGRAYWQLIEVFVSLNLWEPTDLPLMAEILSIELESRLLGQIRELHPRAPHDSKFAAAEFLKQGTKNRFVYYSLIYDMGQLPSANFSTLLTLLMSVYFNSELEERRFFPAVALKPRWVTNELYYDPAASQLVFETLLRLSNQLTFNDHFLLRIFDQLKQRTDPEYPIQLSLDKKILGREFLFKLEKGRFQKPPRLGSQKIAYEENIIDFSLYRAHPRCDDLLGG